MKMLVFDRLSTFPLTLLLLSNSPLYSLLIHFDTSCILLSSLGLSLAEYARYSPLLYFPLFALPDRPLQSTLEPRSRSTPEATTTTSSTPQTRSSSGGSQAGGLAFRFVPLVIFVLAFLRQNLTNYVCTQILCLYNLCIWILGSLACNIRSLSYLSLVLCCDIYRSTLISVMYPACMITVHDRISRVPEEQRMEGSGPPRATGGSLPPPPRARRAPSWLPYGPLGAPFVLYLVPAEETPN